MDAERAMIVRQVTKGMLFGLSFVGGLAIIEIVSGNRGPAPRLACGIFCGMLGGALSGLTLAWRKIRRQGNEPDGRWRAAVEERDSRGLGGQDDEIP